MNANERTHYFVQDSLVSSVMKHCTEVLERSRDVLIVSDVLLHASDLPRPNTYVPGKYTEIFLNGRCLPLDKKVTR